MDDSSFGAWVIFWVFIGAVVGGIIGGSRNNAGGGIVLGALLGPVGWLITFFIDQRPKCPECQGPIPDGAHRCQHCGFTFTTNKTTPAQAVESDKKKCPFCAELIQREAIKCRYCGSDLPAQPPPAAQPPPTPPPAAERQTSYKEQPPKKVIEDVGTAYARHVRETERPPEEIANDQRIPCPLCGQSIRASTLKQGENWCPHCFEKFMAE